MLVLTACLPSSKVLGNFVEQLVASLCAGPSRGSWDTDLTATPHPALPGLQAVFQPGAAISSERGPSEAGWDLACRVLAQQAHRFYCKYAVVGVGEDRGLWGAEKGVCWTPSTSAEAPRGCWGQKDLIHRARGSWACLAPGLGPHQVLEPS